MDVTSSRTRSSGGAAGAGAGSRERRRRLAFFAVCLGNFIVMLDTNIVNLALPHIRESLHGSLAGLLWVANGYTLTVAALILNGGALADRLGNDRAYRWGAVGFAAASLACALAPTLPALVVLRVVQGAFGALLLPSLLGLIPHLFTDPVRRARAVSVWASSGAVALAAGPLLAGVLIDGVGWRSIFSINVPICLAVYAIVRWTIDDAPRRAGAGLDLPGQVLAVAGLGALCFTLIEGPAYGWGSPVIWLAAAVAAVAVVAFVLVERHGASPLLPPRLFADRTFTVAVAAGLVFQFVYFGALFIFALYLQDGLQEGGRDTALTAGLMFLPLTLCTAVTPTLLTNRIAARYGLRGPMVAGAVLGVPGCLLVLLCDTSSPYWLLGVAMGLQGLWSGLTLPPTASLAVAGTPKDLAGTGSGVLNAARQVGGVVGVAVFGALTATAGTVTGGLHLAMGVSAAGVAFIAGLVLVTGTGRRVPAPSAAAPSDASS